MSCQLLQVTVKLAPPRYPSAVSTVCMDVLEPRRWKDLRQGTISGTTVNAQPVMPSSLSPQRTEVLPSTSSVPVPFLGYLSLMSATERRVQGHRFNDFVRQIGRCRYVDRWQSNFFGGTVRGTSCLDFQLSLYESSTLIASTFRQPLPAMAHAHRRHAAHRVHIVEKQIVPDLLLVSSYRSR